MSDTLKIFGKNYSNVTGIKVEDTSGTAHTFLEPSGTLNIVSNGTIDVSKYASAAVDIRSGIVLGRYGADTRIMQLTDVHGPMSSSTDDFVVPVASDRTDVKLAADENFVVQCGFKIHSLPETNVAVIGSNESTPDIPIVVVENGGIGVQAFYKDTSIVSGSQMGTMTAMIDGMSTLPLDAEIKVTIQQEVNSTTGKAVLTMSLVVPGSGSAIVSSPSTGYTPGDNEDSITFGGPGGSNFGSVIPALSGESGSYLVITDCCIKVDGTTIWPNTANLQEKTVTENGTVTPDSGYSGFNKVIVNVAMKSPRRDAIGDFEYDDSIWQSSITAELKE